jgi:hypothetical protein
MWELVRRNSHLSLFLGYFRTFGVAYEATRQQVARWPEPGAQWEGAHSLRYDDWMGREGGGAPICRNKKYGVYVVYDKRLK